MHRRKALGLLGPWSQKFTPNCETIKKKCKSSTSSMLHAWLQSTGRRLHQGRHVSGGHRMAAERTGRHSGKNVGGDKMMLNMRCCSVQDSRPSAWGFDSGGFKLEVGRTCSQERLVQGCHRAQGHQKPGPEGREGALSSSFNFAPQRNQKQEPFAFAKSSAMMRLLFQVEGGQSVSYCGRVSVNHRQREAEGPSAHRKRERIFGG